MNQEKQKINSDLFYRAKQYIKSKGLDESKHKIFQDFTKLEIKEVTEDCDKLYIKGYLSTFGNVDREGDVVDRMAFNETLKEITMLPLLKDHIANTDHQLGSIYSFAIDTKGLLIEACIEKTEKTLHQIKLIKGGHLNTLSMGGLFEYEGKTDDGFFIIKKVMLFEGSVVSCPANPQATFVVAGCGDENEKQVSNENAKQLSKLKQLHDEMTDKRAVQAIRELIEEMEQQDERTD